MASPIGRGSADRFVFDTPGCISETVRELQRENTLS